MDALERIDERILALFTKFSHWFQRLTGRTNFFLCRVCLFLIFVAFLAFVLNYWLPLLSAQTDIPLLAVFSFLLLGCLFRLSLTHDAERQFMEDPAVRSKLQLLEENFGGSIIRLIGLTITPIFVWGLFTVFFENHKGNFFVMVNAGMYPFYGAAFSYLALVDPLPPSKSKVREWVKAFQAGFQKLQSARSPGR